MISGHGTNPIQKKQKRLDVYNTRYLSNPTPYFQQHLIIVLIPPPVPLLSKWTSYVYHFYPDFAIRDKFAKMTTKHDQFCDPHLQK